jgi:hypothetical protein
MIVIVLSLTLALPVVHFPLYLVVQPFFGLALYLDASPYEFWGVGHFQACLFLLEDGYAFLEVFEHAGFHLLEFCGRWVLLPGGVWLPAIGAALLTAVLLHGGGGAKVGLLCDGGCGECQDAGGGQCGCEFAHAVAPVEWGLAWVDGALLLSL